MFVYAKDKLYNINNIIYPSVHPSFLFAFPRSPERHAQRPPSSSTRSIVSILSIFRRNLFIRPHYAGHTTGEDTRLARSCRRSINRIASGFRAVGRVAVRKVAGRSAPHHHYHSFRVPATRDRARNFICVLARFTAPHSRDRIWEPSAPISGSGCVNFRGRAPRELLPRISPPYSSSFPSSCHCTSPLTHTCGLPLGVRPFGHGS